MRIDSVFPVLITRDAGATLRRTLESLVPFSEVLVYDNGSVDSTLEICSRYPNVRTITGEFLGFGATKARAVSLASGDWVFSIDADEYASPELLESIRSLNPDDSSVAYEVERCNLFTGKHVRHGGWGDDWLVRIFDRRQCRFSDRAVHEKVIVPRGVTVRRLKGVLWHEAVTDIGQFLVKINRYTELALNTDRPTHNPVVVVIASAYAMFKSYVIKGGFLEGWRGLVIAYCAGTGTFFRYMRRYAAKVGRASDGQQSPE